MPGQTLAHPGWRGNGISNAAWWREAIFVRLGPDTPPKAVEARLDALVHSGADAVILPMLSDEGADLTAVRAEMGSFDDVDTLLREASARRMHVVVSLPFPRLAAMSDGGVGVVRFWLTHGVAGVDLGKVEGAPTERLRALRAEADHVMGQRILMAAGEPAGRNDPVTLRVESAGSIAEKAAGAVVAVEAAAPAEGIQREAALIPLLFAKGPAVVPDAAIADGSEGQAWLQKILGMRRSNPVLRRGAVAEIATGQPEVSAWLVRPAATSRAEVPLLVLRNSSGSAAALKLQAAVSAMHVRGVFVRPVLRNEGGMGPLNLDRISLPPGAVVVGELRY